LHKDKRANDINKKDNNTLMNISAIQS